MGNSIRGKSIREPRSNTMYFFNVQTSKKAEEYLFSKTKICFDGQLFSGNPWISKEQLYVNFYNGNDSWVSKSQKTF